MKKLTFSVKGMHCASCEKIIKMDLEEMQGVENIQIDHKAGAGSLSFNANLTSQEKIIKTINDSGYEVNNVKII